MRHLPITALAFAAAACSDSAPGSTLDVADIDTADVPADSSDLPVPDAELDVTSDPADIGRDDAADPDADAARGDTRDAADTSDDGEDTPVDAVEDTLIDAAEDADAVEDADASEDADTGAEIDSGGDVIPDVSDDTGAACSYLDLGIWIVECEGGYRYLREWTEFGGAPPESCPTYYTLGPDRFDDAESALASGGCDPDCLAAATTSVSYLRCGRRSGYIIYRSDSPECPELYEFAEGIYESFEAYEEAHPCP